jgi:hypothetical protein
LFVCVDPFCWPERGDWVFDVCLEIEKDGGFGCWKFWRTQGLNVCSYMYVCLGGM